MRICLVLVSALCVGCQAQNDPGEVPSTGTATGASTGTGNTGTGNTGTGNTGTGTGNTSTSNARTIGGCAVFPADNMWNTPVDTLAVHPMSDTYLASIGLDTALHPDFGTFWQGQPIGIPFTTTAADTPLVDLTFLYDDESDPGPYPIPTDAPIEGGPDSDGDRHVLVVVEDNCMLYETFASYPQADGSWTAGSGAVWDMGQNEVRPQDWTSADAAGLAILPGLLTYEDVYDIGEVNHVVRVTMSQLQSAYILPATHTDGQCGFDRDCPPMGLQLRLKADFDETAFGPELQIVLRGMKKYGLIIADTGADFFVSGAHDPRWDDDVLRPFRDLKASDFEAVYTGDAIDY